MNDFERNEEAEEQEDEDDGLGIAVTLAIIFGGAAIGVIFLIFMWFITNGGIIPY